jgi:hypothetical protein
VAFVLDLEGSELGRGFGRKIIFFKEEAACEKHTGMEKPGIRVNRTP